MNHRLRKLEAMHGPKEEVRIFIKDFDGIIRDYPNHREHEGAETYTESYIEELRERPNMRVIVVGYASQMQGDK